MQKRRNLIFYSIFFFIFTLIPIASSYAEEIEYEIIEISTGKTIGKGVKVYTFRDVIKHPYKVGGRLVVEKFIELENGFKIGARIFQEPKLTGFGLLAQLTENDFSWEWYNQVDRDLFKKLQGGTHIKVKISGLPIVEILEEVNFLEKTKLRFKLKDAEKDTHNIVIQKGSVLRFN
jgi:hypothetical protein